MSPRKAAEKLRKRCGKAFVHGPEQAGRQHLRIVGVVGQLANGLDDPAPCYLAVVIVTRGELVTRFSIRGGGPADVDLGYQGSAARDKLIGMTAARRR
jgi:hypothetical protein